MVVASNMDPWLVAKLVHISGNFLRLIEGRFSMISAKSRREDAGRRRRAVPLSANHPWRKLFTELIATSLQTTK
jgi:hypothetical protein